MSMDWYRRHIRDATFSATLFLLMACAWTLGLPAAATAEPSLTVTLEPARVPFHRPATLTVRVRLAEGMGLQSLPSIEHPSEDLEIERRDKDDTALPEGGREIVQRFTLDALRPAVFELPSIEVQIENGPVLRSPPFQFEARELTDAELEAVANVAPMALPEAVLPPRPWGFYLLVTALVLVALMMTWVWWSSRNRLEEAPWRAPWEVAEARLDALAQRGLAENGKHEAYFVDLSAIIRYYIEDRFRLHAPEQTTQEFLEVAAKSQLVPQPEQEMLADFLQQADRVKFARYVPSPEEMSQAFQFARTFIAETKPRPEPEAGEKEVAA